MFCSKDPDPGARKPQILWIRIRNISFYIYNHYIFSRPKFLTEMGAIARFPAKPSLPANKTGTMCYKL